MTATIVMPSLSPTMEDATLDRWYVAEGDDVQIGDVIAEVTTDKATLEIEADQAGRVAKLLVEEGAKGVLVNAPLALLEAPEGQTPAARPARGRAAIARTTVREALRNALAQEMARDATVFVIGEEVGEAQGVFKITEGLLERFGAMRVVDAPTTPNGVAAMAVGAACNGLRPVVEFMNFAYSLQALDPIIHVAASIETMSGGGFRCPIVFRGPHGPSGRVGAQHSLDAASLFTRFPGLTVVAPYRASDAAALLKAAIRHDGPVVLLESERLYGQSFPEEDDADCGFGQARLERSGSDATLVSYGAGMLAAIEAADALAAEHIACDLIDLRSLKPLDMATVIASVRRTNRCVVAEEGGPVCSIGDHLARRLMGEAFDDLDAPVLTVAAADAPAPYAAAPEAARLLSPGAIVEAVKHVCGR
jgi:pyruvate dehydrogenase E1 component beta subunit